MPSTDFQAWIKSDICWCMTMNCPHTDCFRHISNLPSGIMQYSAALLKETDSCPYREDFIAERSFTQYGQKSNASANHQKEPAR